MAREEAVAERFIFTTKDLKPYGDRVLIRQIKNEKSAGGIWLPNGQKSECSFGEVLAIGPGARCLEDGRILPMSVKVGQKVLVMKYAGCEVKVEGEEDTLRMVAEGDIWGVIEGKGVVHE